MPGEGRRLERIGALLVGEREADGTLRYVGRVGTGSPRRPSTTLERKLRPFRRPDSPFDKGRVPKARSSSIRV